MNVIPTFFINGQRYDGAWGRLLAGRGAAGSLGHRVHSAAVNFGSWAPSTALLLVTVTLLALVLSNSGIGAAFEHFWHTALALQFGALSLSLDLREWINDGLLGAVLPRRRARGETRVHRGASCHCARGVLAHCRMRWEACCCPRCCIWPSRPGADWRLGAGVPMPTDTAFAVAFIVMLGSRVPVELRVFLTAASIVDDIGTIAVVAPVLFHRPERGRNGGQRGR